METLANGLAVLFIVHFCWTYYWNCYRKGYAIDVWHFFLLNTLVLVHVMLPFSRSDLNFFAIGAALRGSQAHVTQAYLISATGYLSVLIGGALWRFSLGLGVRRYFAEVVEIPRRFSLLLLNSRNLLLVNGMVAITLSCGVLLYYFATQGIGLNLRGALLGNAPLRALSNFASFYSIMIGTYALARSYARRDRSLLWIVGAIALIQIFSGARSNVIAVFPLTLFVVIMRRGRRFSPLWLVAAVPFILLLGVLLDALRQPSFSLQRSLTQAGLSILYGNTYSDLRDFALVLSYWNGHFFYGLTYLAGLVSFVPRFISSFRETWSLGVITASMAGFSPTEHPGLRVGLFGEAFLNFGIPGVVALGMLVGAVIRLIDLRTKQAIHQLPRTSMDAFSYAIIAVFLGAAENSTGASAVYTMLLVILVSYATAGAARFLKIRV